jgi:type VI secretion system protein ImpM
MFPSVTSVGLVGKAPAQADFIRVEAGEAAAQELLRWVQEADDGLRRTTPTPPFLPTSFVFASSTLRNALVGALAPSRDQVGRVFPLAVFATLPAADLASRFALVPLAFRNFLAAARVLLDDSATLNTGQLSERLRGVPRPTDLEWRAAEDERRSLLEQGTAPWVTELMEVGGPLGPHYALRTFITACKERANEPPRASIVVSCPLGAAGPFPWLELAGRILHWRAHPPPFVWTEAAPSRLLLSLAASAGSSLSYLTRPDASAPSLWPLQTTHAPAQQAARDGLSAEHRTTIDEKRGSMGELFTSLAP